MNRINRIMLAAAGTGLLSLASFSAFADTEAHNALKNKIQANVQKDLSGEIENFTRIAAVAGHNQGELLAKKEAVMSLYKQWHDVKSAALAHYPTSKDFRAVETAANAYHRANQEFVALQAGIAARNGFAVETVSIKKLHAAEQTVAKND